MPQCGLWTGACLRIQTGRKGAIDRWVRMVHLAVAAAKSQGVQVAVESPHRGSLAETLPETQELLAAAALPDLGIDYDTSHIYNSGASVQESLDVLGERIVHVALRDAMADGQFATPGDGKYDFSALFAGLRALDYKGDVVLELEPPEDLPVEAKMAETRRARDYIESLL